MKPGILSLIFIPVLLAACASGPDARGGPGGSRNSDQNSPPGAMRGGSAIVSQIQDQLQLTAQALKLAPRQTVLWDAYVEKISALMADQMKLQPYLARQNAMQQIANKVDTVRNRLTAMEEIQEAASKLYGTLDESQKKTADQMLPGTLPALYSGLGSTGGGGGEPSSPGRNGPGGAMRGPGGGMGGGFGRM